MQPLTRWWLDLLWKSWEKVDKELFEQVPGIKKRGGAKTWGRERLGETGRRKKIAENKENIDKNLENRRAA